jgi:hypothetical protein
MKPEFSGHIFELSSNIKFIKIRPVGAELFHAHGRTVVLDKANIRFRNFANAPNHRLWTEINLNNI